MSVSHGSWTGRGRARAGAMPGVVFRGTTLKGARFAEVILDTPDFEGADLSGRGLVNCRIADGNFRKAQLRGASLVGCKLPRRISAMPT